jgi:hypothetical protein
MVEMGGVQHAVCNVHNLAACLRAYPAIGPIVGAIINAIVVWLIALRFTVRLKRIESTLEFSKRFWELVNQQGELNRLYNSKRKWNKSPPDAQEYNDAINWWWKFFDLILYEFDFFQRGLVRRGRFIEWMKWRWYDFNAAPENIWRTSGMDYRDGWKSWKERPAHADNRLQEFLDSVHRARRVEDVPRVVGKFYPHWWTPWRRKQN